MQVRGLVAAVLFALIVLTGQARADGDLSAAQLCASGPPELPRTDRIREIEVDGRRVLVVLPVGYAASGRRYPTLYLLHGGFSSPESTVRGLDLGAFTADKNVIVVLPAGSPVGMWADWRSDPDGSNQWESFVLRDVVPAVDASFRTKPRRSQRAVAGLSMGGFGSLAHAARAPDLFVAAGAFSGMIDPARSRLLTALAPATPAIFACFEGRFATGFDIYGGPPATESVWYADASAVDKPRNLAGVRTWFGIGDGTPCDEGDAEVLVAEDGDQLWEADFKPVNDELHEALREANVPHTYDPYGCGVHTYRYFRRSLASFWPVMVEAFGTPPLEEFDYRSARRRFEVYGWHIEADPARAPEFLDVVRAGRRGLTLRGSGATSVVTPPRFAARQRVLVIGAADHRFRVQADARGRLAFQVDLGPPHEVQEGRPGARGTRVQRRVEFSPPMRRRPGLAYR